MTTPRSPRPNVRTPDDLADWNPGTALGFPGEFPFTRGIHPTMYRGRLWTMRQYAGFGNAAQSNDRYRYLLGTAADRPFVAFDLPTQMGFDSDHPRARGEVGKVGVAIDSLEDMERLFEGIPLARVSTSMTINATAAILLVLYAAVARQQGANLRELSGTVQNDILKEYVARGTYIYPPRPAMRIVTDLFAWCASPSCPTGRPFPFPATTFARPVRLPRRKWPSRWQTRIAYVDAAIEAWPWMTCCAATFVFLQRAQQLAGGGCQVPRCPPTLGDIMRDRFDARVRGPSSCAFTRRRPAAHDRPAAGQQYGPRRGAGTRRRPGRRQSLHANGRDEALALPTEAAARSACARSRSWRTKPAWPTPSTLWAARTKLKP